MPTSLRPPQLIVDARMLYIVWLPADGDAVASLVPHGLKPAQNRAVFMNQYVVDDAAQTSNSDAASSFGAYSLTYLGADLADLDTEAGVPGRWWTHYLNSSENMNAYAAEHGVPTSSGRTELELDGQRLVATTFADGTPIIRTTAEVRLGRPTTQRGSAPIHHRGGRASSSAVAIPSSQTWRRASRWPRSSSWSGTTRPIS